MAAIDYKSMSPEQLKTMRSEIDTELHRKQQVASEEALKLPFVAQAQKQYQELVKRRDKLLKTFKKSVKQKHKLDVDLLGKTA